MSTFVLSFMKIRQLAQSLLKWAGYGTVIPIFLIRREPGYKFIKNLRTVQKLQDTTCGKYGACNA